MTAGSQKISLELVFELDNPVPPGEFWDRLGPLLRESDLAEERYDMAGIKRPVSFASVRTAIDKDEDGMFWLIGQNSEVGYRLGRGRVMSLTVEGNLQVGGLETWVMRFEDLPSLIMARVYEPEYEQWENEAFLPHYEAAGRSTEGLPRIWDETFEEYQIDTSKNAGRTVGRKGYKEALGSLMWLAKPFWKLTEANEDEVRKAFEVKEVGRLLRVRLSDTLFSYDNPPTENMRKVLFPNCGEPPAD